MNRIAHIHSLGVCYIGQLFRVNILYFFSIRCGSRQETPWVNRDIARRYIFNRSQFTPGVPIHS